MVAALLGLLPGCGATAHVARGGTLQVALTEYHVRPQSASAPAGALTIDVHNYGRLSHNLVIARGGHPELSTMPIPPGQSAQLNAALAPDQYLLASTILSDQALGAYGTLTITR